MSVGQDFLKELVAKLPEASRGPVEAAFASEEAADALKAVEDGVKRQADYSRGMDELREQQTTLAQQKQALEGLQTKVGAKYEEQMAWWEANQPLVEAGKRTLAAAGVDPTVTHKPDSKDPPPDAVRMEDVETLINEREMGAADFFAATQDLSFRHFTEFGERLDLTGLMRDPKIKEVGLLKLYDLKYADRYEEKRQKADTERIEKRVEERLAEERKTLNSRPPYPVAPAEGSPLDVLTTKDPDPSQFSAEAAADEYLAAVAKRTG